MLTAPNYCTKDFPRQGELRLQLQKMQSCSIFLTILHQAMQRKMSTKPHFWTYLSQIPFLYLSKPLFVFVTNPFFYLSQISFPTSTLISTLIWDQTACTYDHLMKPSQVLWLQKYLLEWVDLSLLGLSRVFRIKTNSIVLCGQDLKRVSDCPSWLYPGWLSPEFSYSKQTDSAALCGEDLKMLSNHSC